MIMRYTLKNILLLLTVLFTVTCFQACKEEGCTDPNAENYDSDADDDDGSCTFARAKFIGTYGAGDSCDGGDATSNVVSIAESATAFNALNITNETLGITVSGTVTGDSFTIDDSFISNGVSLNMLGNGTYSIGDDGQERIDVEYTLSAIVDGQNASQSCIGIWLRN